MLSYIPFSVVFIVYKHALLHASTVHLYLQEIDKSRNENKLNFLLL